MIKPQENWLWTKRKGMTSLSRCLPVLIVGMSCPDINNFCFTMKNIFSDALDIDTEIWTCARGHPFCGECLDVASVTESNTDTTVTIIDGDKELNSSVRSSSVNTLQKSFSHLEISSYVRYFI